MRAPSVVAVEFDPVGASSDLITHGANKTIDAIGFLRALRNSPFRDEPGAVRGSCNDGACRNKHTRTRNDSLLDRLLQLYIGVASAFGSEITNGSETCHERR